MKRHDTKHTQRTLPRLEWTNLPCQLVWGSLCFRPVMVLEESQSVISDYRLKLSTGDTEECSEEYTAPDVYLRKEEHTNVTFPFPLPILFAKCSRLSTSSYHFRSTRGIDAVCPSSFSHNSHSSNRLCSVQYARDKVWIHVLVTGTSDFRWVPQYTFLISRFKR